MNRAEVVAFVSQLVRKDVAKRTPLEDIAVFLSYLTEYRKAVPAIEKRRLDHFHLPQPGALTSEEYFMTLRPIDQGLLSRFRHDNLRTDSRIQALLGIAILQSFDNSETNGGSSVGTV